MNDGRKSKSGNYFPKQAPGYFWCSFSPGRKSFYPSRECTYHDQQVMVVLVRFHFSEVHSQVFKGQCAFQLNTLRFCLNTWEAALTCEQAACSNPFCPSPVKKTSLHWSPHDTGHCRTIILTSPVPFHLPNLNRLSVFQDMGSLM